MWPTIIILAIIVAVVAAIVVSMIVNKAKGKTSCSCGCGGCAMRDMCHSRRDKAQGGNADGEGAQENRELENPISQGKEKTA